MMKNKDSYAVAVRKPDGEIEIDKNMYVSMTERVKLFSLPFVRGIFSFADTMILGMRTLTWSASFFEDEEGDEEPGRFEKFLTDRFGEKLENAVMAVVMVVSLFPAFCHLRHGHGDSGGGNPYRYLHCLYQGDIRHG